MHPSLRMVETALVVRGGYVHTPTRGGWVAVEDALISVDADGTIVSVRDRPARASASEREAAIAAARATASSVPTSTSSPAPPDFYELPQGGFLLPGLVDCHIHAPQFAAAGTGLDLPLMQWLERYTFPSEARMADTRAAAALYTVIDLDIFY